jgi:alpha-N-acetylglucosaminidase
MLGVGLTMEGIEQNPVMYELMLENVWRETPVDLGAWLKVYAFRRYGKNNEDAQKAWNILRHSVYADSTTNGGAESIITARPTFNKNPGGTSNTNIPYDPMEVVKAWDHLIAAIDDLKQSDGYQFDIVDVTRQVLANYALDIQQQIAEDFKNKNIQAFKKNTARFIKLITDMDDLLATRKDFLLGNWLEASKSWGTTENEKRLYEINARNLITLWGDKNSRLHEYACKQWAGLLKGFYKKRWEQFFTFISSAMISKKETDMKLIEEQLKDWEWKWVNSREVYTTKPKGDAVMISKEMHLKYFTLITKNNAVRLSLSKL